MMYHNQRPVVVASQATKAALFVLGKPDGEGWYTYRCRSCAYQGATVLPVPEPHVCPEEGSARCSCTTTLFVRGLSRFYIDGDDPGCPVHGGGEPYSPAGERIVQRKRGAFPESGRIESQEAAGAGLQNHGKTLRGEVAA